MLYLLLAIASSALVSICMRVSEKYVRSNMVMFTANYAVCAAISRLYFGHASLFPAQSGLTWAITLGAVSGFLYLASFVLLQTNVRHNGVILSSAAMKLGGVLIPVLLAVVLFRERMGSIQLVGVTAAIGAVVLMNFEKSGGRKGDRRYLLLVLLISSGVTDAMVNIYDKTGAAALKNHYLFFTFLAALLFALAMALAKKQKPGLADILCGLMIGVPNYFSSRFLLLSLGSVPAVVAYPVFSAGTIVAVTLVGALAFQEKLNRPKRWAMALILAALVLLNI